MPVQRARSVSPPPAHLGAHLGAHTSPPPARAESAPPILPSRRTLSDTTAPRASVLWPRTAGSAARVDRGAVEALMARLAARTPGAFDDFPASTYFQAPDATGQTAFATALGAGAQANAEAMRIASEYLARPGSASSGTLAMRSEILADALRHGDAVDFQVLVQADRIGTRGALTGPALAGAIARVLPELVSTPNDPHSARRFEQILKTLKAGPHDVQADTFAPLLRSERTGLVAALRQAAVIPHQDAIDVALVPVAAGTSDEANARNTQGIRTLQRAGYDVDSTLGEFNHMDHDDRMPLASAVALDNAPAIGHLLRNASNTSWSVGQAAFDAVRLDRPELVQEFLAFAEAHPMPGATDPAWAMSKAASLGAAGVVQSLIGQGTSASKRDLRAAARAGHTQVVGLLLDAGVRGRRSAEQAARSAGQTDADNLLAGHLTIHPSRTPIKSLTSWTSNWFGAATRPAGSPSDESAPLLPPGER